MKCPYCRSNTISINILFGPAAFSGFKCSNCGKNIAIRPTMYWTVIIRLIFIATLIFMSFSENYSSIVLLALAFIIVISTFAPFATGSLLMEHEDTNRKSEYIIITALSFLIVIYIVYRALS